MGKHFDEVAPGVLRMGTPLINWFLVADDAGGVTVVDCGAPRYRPQLEPGLAQMGRTIDDVKAIVLTHGDADHKGWGEKLRAENRVPVLVHSADAELTRTNKGRRRERSLLPYLRYPATWRLLGALARGGLPMNVEQVETFEDGDVLEVPGRPRAILAPGHTPGSVALLFSDHGTLIVGDILFDYNVLTGRRGPQIGPGGFNQDSDEAMVSLDRVEKVDAGTILFGHGDPWHDGAPAAVAAARAAGRS